MGMAIKYSEKVMDHFMNPRNVGELDSPDGIGEVGNPACGDIMTFTIKVKDNKLADVKFKTFGCGAAIAVSSMISEMAKGKTLDEAMTITNKDVALQLEGLPANKMHCSNLGADALHAAIESYKQSSAKNLAKPEKVVAPEKEDDHDHDEHYTRKCPSCDIPVPPGLPSCAKCGCEVKGD
jgi:nitrogen fixation protein NifU and related proteins